MPSAVRMRSLLETGVHFGHRTNKWNPKMDEFIFTKRNGIHIIDLQITLRNLHNFHDMIANLVAGGGNVLFVGTKRQAQEIVQREATRCSMPYINYRWLGGTLTNWKTIRSRIDTLKQLEKRRDAGEFDRLTKKEGLVLQRKIAKLQLRLGGIREMKSTPELLIVVDAEREHTAVKEANILKIPVLALVDTNANPDYIDHILPANDDAMRSIRLLIGALADAVMEGHNLRQSAGIEDDEAQQISNVYDDELSDEELLGESTLAKLRDSSLFDDGEGEASADAASEEA
ncbi:MAG: 30S ribosomal protein S2 [Chloroflexi bacterium]|nr:30S ribosomal protein S2 [Chloroflexota bacterium]MCY3582896.1 30S ribosomal protein S2 [Chloroflexota bacterium]MCY3715670.1 30S ribosomal protein S2 [Chloroflexota bacterium]MDE2650592.1 30S ribosomal protein S2 [Chloroflexota bacterium]MXV93295.1 30S ribosomal protein S2 [Chloroflexota bacterium]